MHSEVKDVKTKVETAEAETLVAEKAERSNCYSLHQN
jgi:hypothetical protein